MKVSLFITCLADQLYPQVGVSAVRLLARYGCEVDFPEGRPAAASPLSTAVTRTKRARWRAG